jgi:hypothetical protein
VNAFHILAIPQNFKMSTPPSSPANPVDKRRVLLPFAMRYSLIFILASASSECTCTPHIPDTRLGICLSPRPCYLKRGIAHASYLCYDCICQGAWRVPLPPSPSFSAKLPPESIEHSFLAATGFIRDFRPEDHNSDELTAASVLCDALILAACARQNHDPSPMAYGIEQDLIRDLSKLQSDISRVFQGMLTSHKKKPQPPSDCSPLSLD